MNREMQSFDGETWRRLSGRPMDMWEYNTEMDFKGL
jgi:hypothetical protein